MLIERVPPCESVAVFALHDLAVDQVVRMSHEALVLHCPVLQNKVNYEVAPLEGNIKRAYG